MPEITVTSKQKLKIHFNDNKRNRSINTTLKKIQKIPNFKSSNSALKIKCGIEIKET